MRPTCLAETLTVLSALSVQGVLEALPAATGTTRIVNNQDGLTGSDCIFRRSMHGIIDGIMRLITVHSSGR